jgi:hypothetical protein
MYLVSFVDNTWFLTCPSSCTSSQVAVARPKASSKVRIPSFVQYGPPCLCLHAEVCSCDATVTRRFAGHQPTHNIPVARAGRSIPSSCRLHHGSSVSPLSKQRCIFSHLFRNVQAIFRLAPTIPRPWGHDLNPLELISEQPLLTTQPAHPLAQVVCRNFDYPVMATVVLHVTRSRSRCSQLDIPGDLSQLPLSLHFRRDWPGVRFCCLSQLLSQFQKSILSPDP